MQRLMGLARKAITEYNMIEPGDKVGVGVSGGKDSVAMLVALAQLRDILTDTPFTLSALTLDSGFEQMDFSKVAGLCKELEVEYHIMQTGIADIVFNQRKEHNPCSLCARMRRGALHNLALEHGCNKVALGHHKDDVIETFFLNLFYEGRLGAFSPVTYLSRKNITMIRPLVYAFEKEVAGAHNSQHLPIVKSTCPVDGHTTRQEMKDFIALKTREDRYFKQRIFGAIKRGHLNDF